MTARRQRQVAELLHKEISLLIQRQARDPRLDSVTITGVDVTPDLQDARVYVSVLGDRHDVQQAMAGLESAAGFLRRQLGDSLSLRVTPTLTFRLDNSFEQGSRIDQLLDTLFDDSQHSEKDAE